MTNTTFVSIDGPKGSGKTTLLKCLRDALPRSLTVAVYSEKELDPLRDVTEALIEQHRGRATAEAELEIVKLLAAGRAEITNSLLANPPAHVLLFDRWYPSDAYFRRWIEFEEVMAINMDFGVARPDLVLATVCDPLVSWERATSRPRGLASKAGLTKEQHLAATRAFERAIDAYGFTRLETGGPLQGAVRQAREAVLEAIHSR
jgi:thymidylate kinase